MVVILMKKVIIVQIFSLYNLWIDVNTCKYKNSQWQHNLKNGITTRCLEVWKYYKWSHKKEINLQKQDSQRCMRKLTVPFACYHHCTNQGFYKWELNSCLCNSTSPAAVRKKFYKTFLKRKSNTLRNYL